MKTTLTTRLHAATWIVASLLGLAPLFEGKPAEQIVGTGIATIFWMGVYYFFFARMVPAFLLSNKLLHFFSVSVILLLVLPFAGYSLLFLSKAIFRGSFANMYDVYSLHMHLSGFKALVLAGLFGSFFRLIVESCTSSAKSNIS